MKKKDQGKPALDLIEEGVHLLRTAPAAVILPYYVGSLPFILGLLYFLADMSRSAFAEDHLFEASLALTALFFWMKAWQSVFASRLKARVAGLEAPDITLRRVARLVVVQTILQPLGLLLIPAALALTVPFAWVFALFQNITVFGDGDTYDAGAVFGRSWKQAKFWVAQNHVLLTFLSLIGLVVFADLAIIFLTIPGLLKMLFGIETVFTVSGYAMLNTTFLGVLCGVSYLCLDPLVKALYVLRCFYGEAVQSGEDLKAELKRFDVPGAGRRIALAILASALLWGTVAPVFAEQVSPGKLDESISKVIRKPEFQWRLPREKPKRDPEDSFLGRYLEKLLQYTVDTARTVQGWWNRLMKWINDWWPGPPGDTREPGAPGRINMRMMLILTGVILVLLGIILWRIRKRRKQKQPVQAVAMAAMPDLNAEDVDADMLAEEGWQAMARQFLEKGELRLALRALYLAALALLADRDMLSIARFKSNRDYLNELKRRAHEHAALQNVFSENIVLFEQSWYGRHEVTLDIFNHFNDNTERIRTLAQE
jgi:hypothetical protein